jgi:N-acetylmuramoyl-L-alanine amidase
VINLKVCLDAGHGGNDPGSAGFGLFEKDIALEVSLKAADILRNKGVDVVLSRTADITLDPEPRIKTINSVNADIVVSVHYNAFDSRTRGFEAVYGKYKNDNSVTLAQCIFDKLKGLNLPARRIYSKDNSTGDSDYYFMIRRIEATSVIVESAFIDNSEDNRLLQSIDFRNRNAEAIAKGILDYRDRYFGEKVKISLESPSDWAKASIDKMVELGIMMDDSKDNFNPKSYVTRQELAVVADRIIKYITGKQE